MTFDQLKRMRIKQKQLESDLTNSAISYRYFLDTEKHKQMRAQFRALLDTCRADIEKTEHETLKHAPCG
jgi:hypothetical protein